MYAGLLFLSVVSAHALSSLPFHYSSNSTSAPGWFANASHSMTPPICFREDPNPWYCSCSSLFNSLATPTLISTTYTITENNGKSFVASYRRTGSALAPGSMPPEACCSSCSIVADDVRLLYWPVATGGNGTSPITAAPSVQYTLHSNNVEFISPSIYVAYHNLRATRQCYFFSEIITQGNLYNTTIAYSPESVSMRLCPGPEVVLDDVPATAYPKLFDSINITALQYGTSCYMGNYYRDGGFFSSYRDSIPERAVFSLPNDLSLLDPAWDVCSPFTYGALDPPSALKRPTAPIGLVPASVLVTSPTSTGQARPQEPIARPIPTLNKPPVQTPVGGQPPNIDRPDKDSGFAEPADEKDPNDSPQATPVIQHSAPDPPAPDPPTGPNRADRPNGDSNDQASVEDPATNDPQANNEPPTPDPEAMNDQSPSKGSFSSGSDTDKDPHDVAVKHAKDPANTELKPAEDPASTQDSYDNDSPPNKIPIGEAQDPESDSADDNGSQNTDSQPAEYTPAAAPSVTTIAGHSIQLPAPQSFRDVILVDGQSITAGHDPRTVSSTKIALQTNGDLILGAATYHILLPTNPPTTRLAPFVITAAGHSIEMGPSQSNVITVDGQRITAGAAPTIVADTYIALKTNGDLTLGTSIIHNIFPTAPVVSLSHFTVGDQTITLSSSRVLVAGTTHAPGEPVFTVDNTIISLGPSALVIGSSTIPLTPPSSSVPEIITTAAGHVLTILPTGIVISGTTLTANGPAVTISSTLFSYGPSDLIVGTSTIPLTLPTLPSSPFTTLGHAFTALPSGAIAVAGVTLTPNALGITVSGTSISLGENGLMIGTTTIPLPAAATASLETQGLGGFILAGINGGINTTQDNSPRPAAVFLGGADRVLSSKIILAAATVFVWLRCYK